MEPVGPARSGHLLNRSARRRCPCSHHLFCKPLTLPQHLACWHPPNAEAQRGNLLTSAHILAFAHATDTEIMKEMACCPLLEGE